MDVYRENGVTVISDEIWSDIILGGHKHIPTQSVSEDARQRTIALYAPARPSTWPGWSEATTSYTTKRCGTVWPPAAKNTL